jgi:hypothetical protein
VTRQQPTSPADPSAEAYGTNRFLSTIRRSVASHGLVNGLLYLVDRALARATRGRCHLTKYYFVAQPVPEQPLTAASRATQTRVFRVSGIEDIISTFPRPPEVIARRFADGAVCFVAERDGSLVGFIWIKRERYDEDTVRCEYVLDATQGIAWDFDAWVAPEFRMTRAFVQLWEAANRYLRQCGCRWSGSRISAFNSLSLASHRRLGAIRLSTGLFLSVGSAQLALFSAPPYVHLGFGAGSRPKLLIRPPDQSGARGR